MADLGDMATEIEGEHLAAGIARAKAPIATGAAGQCDECGHWMPRLVDGRCGFCRDGRLPPDDWEPPTPPADFIPKPKETPQMAGKTINLPPYADDAVIAVETFAREENCTQGEAARRLIEAGSRAGEPQPGPIDMTAISLSALFEELERRIASTGGEMADLITRAEAAERKLATIRETVA